MIDPEEEVENKLYPFLWSRLFISHSLQAEIFILRKFCPIVKITRLQRLQ